MINKAIPSEPNAYWMSRIYTVNEDRMRTQPVPNMIAKINKGNKLNTQSKSIGYLTIINIINTRRYPIKHTINEDIILDNTSISRGKYIFLINPAFPVKTDVPPVMQDTKKWNKKIAVEIKIHLFSILLFGRISVQMI